MNWYARTGTATSVVVRRKRTGGSGERKVIVGSAQPYSRQGAKNMIASARENAEQRKSRQRRRKTCLYRFYYRRVYLRDEVVERAVPKRMNLTGRNMLGHRALNKKLDELGKQERGYIPEFARPSAKLNKKLETAEERIARVGADV